MAYRLACVFGQDRAGSACLPRSTSNATAGRTRPTGAGLSPAAPMWEQSAPDLYLAETPLLPGGDRPDVDFNSNRIVSDFAWFRVSCSDG